MQLVDITPEDRARMIAHLYWLGDLMRRKLKRKAANKAMLKKNEEKRKKKGRKGVFEEGL